MPQFETNRPTDWPAKPIIIVCVCVYHLCLHSSSFIPLFINLKVFESKTDYVISVFADQLEDSLSCVYLVYTITI